MKTKYSIAITDLGHQHNHITSKRIQLFQEYGADAFKAQIFSILIKRREIELISGGSKLFEVKII